MEIWKYGNMSIYRGFITLYKLEGIAGYYRGNGINMCRIFPQNGITFCGYTYTKRYTDNQLLIGGVSGAAGTILTYPLKTMRTHLISNEGKVFLKEIIAQKSLYRGLSLAICTTVPYNAIMYYSYNYLISKGYSNPISGFFSASTSVLICYPLDLYCRRYQLGSGSMLDCYKQLCPHKFNIQIFYR